MRKKIQIISLSSGHKIQTLTVKHAQRFKGTLRSVNANTELKFRKITGNARAVHKEYGSTTY